MTDKLKPCPFCGKKLIVIHRWWTHTYEDSKNCFEGTAAIPVDDEEAIRMWNTRKPMDRIVEQLEEVKFWTTETFDDFGYSNDDSREVIDFDTAIEIVKAGDNDV